MEIELYDSANASTNSTSNNADPVLEQTTPYCMISDLENRMKRMQETLERLQFEIDKQVLLHEDDDASDFDDRDDTFLL